MRNEIDDKADVPNINNWTSTFRSIDEVIEYYNQMASLYYYFYVVDKTKYISLGEIADKQKDLSPEVKAILLNKNPIEYSFSLYCYQYRKDDLRNCCKSHINFVLDVAKIKIDNNGNLEDLTYKRTSIFQNHSHDLLRSEFEPSFKLLTFLNNDLFNFGSNSAINPKNAESINISKSVHFLLSPGLWGIKPSKP